VTGCFKTASLGIVYLLNQLAISFQSTVYWDFAYIKLIRKSISSNTIIEEEIISVNNITRIAHWETHLITIDNQRKANNRKGRDLWENRNREFPNLIFCKETEKQITNLSIDDALFNCFWDSIRLLDDNIRQCESDSELLTTTGLKISDESNTVKNNPKIRRYREFSQIGLIKPGFCIYFLQ